MGKRDLKLNNGLWSFEMEMKRCFSRALAAPRKNPKQNKKKNSIFFLKQQKLLKGLIFFVSLREERVELGALLQWRTTMFPCLCSWKLGIKHLPHQSRVQAQVAHRCCPSAWWNHTRPWKWSIRYWRETKSNDDLDLFWGLQPLSWLNFLLSYEMYQYLFHVIFCRHIRKQPRRARRCSLLISIISLAILQIQSLGSLNCHFSHVL